MSTFQMIECDLTVEDKEAVEKFRNMRRLPSDEAAVRLLVRIALGLTDKAEIGNAEPKDGGVRGPK